MSARKIRREREIAERKRKARAAGLVARQNGCACGPEVEVATIGERVHGITLCHEDWCPLLRSYGERRNPDVPTGLVVLVPDEWTEESE